MRQVLDLVGRRVVLRGFQVRFYIFLANFILKACSRHQLLGICRGPGHICPCNHWAGIIRDAGSDMERRIPDLLGIAR